MARTAFEHWINSDSKDDIDLPARGQSVADACSDHEKRIADYAARYAMGLDPLTGRVLQQSELKG